jgi:hypothetical protein
MAIRINRNTTNNVSLNESGFTTKLQRVYDVILDDSHPLYLGGDSIGVIYYGDVNLSIDPQDKLAIRGLNKATPIYPYISYIPSLQEIVKIEELTSDNIYLEIGGNSNRTKAYYYPPINLFNIPTQNALPSSGKKEIKLGEYLKEGLTKKLQRFEGDLIFEGRFGNGIRFGSSTPNGKNNWSNNSSIGEPITIISNGIDNIAGDALLEDINSTKSIFFMTSNQNIDNFIPASLNLKSLNTEFTITTKQQVLIADTPTPRRFESIDNAVTEIQDILFQINELQDVITSSPPTEVDRTITNNPIFELLQDQIEEGQVELIDDTYNIEIGGATPDGGDSNSEGPGFDVGNTDATCEPLKDPSLAPPLDRNYKEWNESTQITNKLTDSEGKVIQTGDSDIWFYNKSGNATYVMRGMDRSNITVTSQANNPRIIEKIFIHTTAGHNERRKPADTLRGHFNNNEWDFGGYHWMIEKNGKATRFYPDCVEVNGVKSQNPTSIHINWMGGRVQNTPEYPLYRDSNGNLQGGKALILGGDADITDDQVLTLDVLLRTYLEAYPNAVVEGHNQAENGGNYKPCPLFWVPTFAERLGIPSNRIGTDSYKMGINNPKYPLSELKENARLITEIFAHRTEPQV